MALLKWLKDLFGSYNLQQGFSDRPILQLSDRHLLGKRVYLSGPIQNDTSSVNWREEPKRVLTERFGVDLFDPFCDPKQQWTPTLLKAQEDRNYESMKTIARSFVRKDLAMVDRADIVIAYLPYDMSLPTPHITPTTGTVHEIINSNNAKKPTLLVTNHTDKAYLPLWYYGFIPHECMFAGWDALYDYLAEVDVGLHRGDDRWSYVYGDL